MSGPSYHVRQQAEQIIDEGVGRQRGVIVRMGHGDARRLKLLKSIRRAVQLRSQVLSARDLLPVPAERFSKKMSARRIRRFEAASFAAQAASVSGPRRTPSHLRSQGLKQLEPLLGHEIVKAVKPAGKVTPFWTSKSVFLELPKDDVNKLTKSLVGIEDIYPNRVLAIPRVAEVKHVPEALQDEKTSVWGVNKIGALSVWGAYDTWGEDVTVAVLDTGVDPDHPDIDGKIAAWAEFDRFGAQVADSKAHDTDQHGTHVVGTIVGGDESDRFIGVAPGAKVAVALVLDGSRGGTDAQVLRGIDWAVEQKVDVISMSLGGLTIGPEVPATYTEAIFSSLAAGIPIVTAIGNEGHQTTGSPGNDLFAFAVGATDYRDMPAGFSGGRTHIIRKSSFLPPELLPFPYSKPDVSAPGVAITSSVPRGKWAAFNGTSMATPHVAGAIALLLSATNIKQVVPTNERAFVIQDLIMGSVDELGEAGQDHRYGFGRVNALRAVGSAWERGYRFE